MLASYFVAQIIIAFHSFCMNQFFQWPMIVFMKGVSVYVCCCWLLQYNKLLSFSHRVIMIHLNKATFQIHSVFAQVLFRYNSLMCHFIWNIHGMCYTNNGLTSNVFLNILFMIEKSRKKEMNPHKCSSSIILSLLLIFLS